MIAVFRSQARFSVAVVATLVGVAVAVSGCSLGARLMPGSPSEEDTGTRVAQNVGAMPWAPKALIDMETQAEVIVRAAQADQWEKAGGALQRVQADWPKVRKEVARRHVDDALLERVDKLVAALAQQVAAQAPLRAATKANALTGYAAAFMNLFQVTLAPQIPTMDFHVRGAMLAASEKKWGAVTAQAAALDGVWLSYHPVATAHPPANQAKVEQLLAALAADAEAQDSDAVHRDGRALLAEVQKLRTAVTQGK